MNGIQEIGFPYAIPAAYTHHALFKLKFLLKIVLELKKRYGRKKKSQKD